MENVITLGRRLVPVEQIVFVEPFDPASNPQLKSDKAFKARVVLLNRDTVLTEQTVQEMADAQAFRMLTDDGIAANHRIAFSVESFSPTDSFKPTRPYLTRLKWRDLDGNEQSKLLLTKPETVIAVLLRGIEPTAERKEAAERKPTRAARRRRDYGKLAATRT
jgi:hypothetical protein